MSAESEPRGGRFWDADADAGASDPPSSWTDRDRPTRRNGPDEEGQGEWASRPRRGETAGGRRGWRFRLDVVAAAPGRVGETERMANDTSRPGHGESERPMPLGDLAWALAGLLLAGLVFVVLGMWDRELGPEEARLGFAAWGKPAPFGQVAGHWDPGHLAGQTLPVWAASQWEEKGPTAFSVRVPQALAGLLLGWLLSRRLAGAMGLSAGVLFAVCWYGSLALIDRSEALFWPFLTGLRVMMPLAGFDLLIALPVLAAVDRIAARGFGPLAGLWAALALLTGGWPALAVIAFCGLVARPSMRVLNHEELEAGTAILDKTSGQDKSPSHRGRLEHAGVWAFWLLPLVAFATWSGWAWSTAPALVWGAAITLPLKSPAAWDLVPRALAWALPWTPLAVLAGLGWSRLVGGGYWNPATRDVVAGRFKAALAAALAGTMLPGLGQPALGVILLAVSTAAAALMVTLLQTSPSWWKRRAGPSNQPEAQPSNDPRADDPGAALGWLRPAAILLTILATAVWCVTTLPLMVRVILVAPYYHPVLIPALVASVILIVSLGWVVASGSTRGVVVAWILLAALLKTTHWGYAVPEWNYRVSAGPWGRAIGQWVPPLWPIHTLGSSFNAWPADLLFAAGHPIKQLTEPRMLGLQPGSEPKFILLHPEEFRHWPANAPPLREVFSFRDPMSLEVARVLARTEGQPDWRRKLIAERAQRGDVRSRGRGLPETAVVDPTDPDD